MFANWTTFVSLVVVVAVVAVVVFVVVFFVVVVVVWVLAFAPAGGSSADVQSQHGSLLAASSNALSSIRVE